MNISFIKGVELRCPIWYSTPDIGNSLERGSLQMVKNAVFLFAPKFCEFGVEVAKKWAAEENEQVVIHGLCTGSAKVKKRVSESLGSLGGEFFELNQIEKNWINQEPTAESCEKFERNYPRGTFGHTVVADRRVGVGYVSNGYTRPDLTGDLALKNNVAVPLSYVVGLYDFLEQIFEQLQPDIVFCYAVAGAPAFALSVICKRRNCAFTQLAPTRLGSGFLVDTSARCTLEPVTERFSANSEISAKSLDDAQALLSEFRSKPQKPHYQEFQDRLQGQRKLLNVFIRKKLSASKTALSAYLTRSSRKWESARRKWQEGSLALREFRAKKQHFINEDKLPKNFVFFPLHVSPEASTMVLAPEFTDQIAVIESLSKAIPAGMCLVVKEHMPMLGRRPSGFYERIEAMPRLVLADPGISGIALIQNAALTAVITGTAGWEALLLGRPTLSLGPAHYECLGAGAVFESDFTKLPEAIGRSLETPPPNEKDLVRYLATLLEESFELPTELLWGEYTEEPAEKREACCAAIGRQIAVRLAGHQRTKSNSSPSEMLAE